MEPLLKARDVGKVLGISTQGAYNLAKSGALRSVSFKASGDRSTIRFRPEDVRLFIEKSLRTGREVGAQ